MIPIKKEPKILYKEFKCYEKCLFCNKETNTWYLKLNKPICVDCSKSKNISDLN